MPGHITSKYQLNPESIWVIFLLAALMAFVSLSIDLLTPGLPILTKTFDASANNVKLVIHAFFFGFGIAHLFWGRLSDIFGRRTILLSGVILYCLATSGCIFTNNLSLLILFRLLQGIGGATGVILSRAIIRDIYGAERATKAISSMMLIFVPIPVITPIVGGYVITHFDWIVIFWIMEISGLLALTLITLLLTETAPLKTLNPTFVVSENDGFMSILKNHFFMKNTLANMFCFGGLLICLTNLSYFLSGNYHFSPQQIGFVIAIFDAALAIGVYSVRAIVPRLGVEKAIYIGLYLTMFGWLCIMNIYSVRPELLNFMGMGMILSCIGMGIVMSLASGQAMVPFTMNAGAASSLYGIIQYGGGTLIVLLAGLIQGEALLYAIFIATLSAFLALINYWILGDRRKSPVN